MYYLCLVETPGTLPIQLFSIIAQKYAYESAAHH